MRYYPLNLNVEDRRCVVIGGGKVDERKVGTLLACQARVLVISPTLTSRLRHWAEAGKLTHMARAYRQGDLEGAFLCIAATGDRAVSEQVWREGDARGVLVNAADDVDHSHFIAPAVVRRGDLTIAISTGGHSPALAVEIKEKLAALFGPEYGDLVRLLGALRPRLKAELGPEQRRAFVQAVLNEDIMALLKQGDEPRAWARMEEILESCKERG